ncbi:chemotaxis protein CheW [Thalassolituus sp. ST750PaO-4]|uniref:chemotaxis protein CheW n=1 Tax=Thalassolituus sp. ST750PaO-4 TaxID=2742965 RepID=UPI001CE28DCF|nr:chemotaxis protein CheW [Thalassolituus sp. ST750PaO-4]MCA6059218.1 chemotaxis protein CheW [Thalassolituus sp. ST750PaO-4]
MNAQKWLTFRLDETCYCLPVRQVREVAHFQPPEPVPGAPAVVSGIINQRGDVVTVLDGRALLGLAAQEATDDSRIMTLELEHEVVGMVIDQVQEIIELNESDIEPPAQTQALILGTYQQGEELLVALNADQLGKLPEADG